jgi:hypothetical protein
VDWDDNPAGLRWVFQMQVAADLVMAVPAIPMVRPE